MQWPTPQDYSEAVQNPQLNFADKDLQSGATCVSPLGLPVVASGSFASVYSIIAANGQRFAVRCFLKEVRQQHERYMKISDFVMNDSLPYTVNFHYLQKGIRVRGEWYPILKMDWIDGVSLDAFVRDNLAQPARLAKLAQQFKTMISELQRAGIAHGDLQHGNILVTANDELRLVDYDGMYVPQLAGTTSGELGHRNYQHPDRDSNFFNERIDSFSAWSIWTALTALAADPTLAANENLLDECLLFRQADFRYPLISETFATLEKHKDSTIRYLSRALRTLLSLPPQNTPFLSEVIEIPEDLPEVDPGKNIITPYSVAANNDRALRLPPGYSPEADLELKQHWPALTDYMHAVTNPSRSFVDPNMHALYLVRDHGELRAQGSDHGAVFKFREPDTQEDLLVKVFLNIDQLVEQRYKSLFTYLNGTLPAAHATQRHFADFKIIPSGIKAANGYFPMVKMKAVHGPTLFEAVEAGRYNRSRMQELIGFFVKIMGVLETAGIIHGDIEPNNFIVKKDRLVILDYDLTTTPYSRALASRVPGNKHYRHPKLRRGDLSPDDHFASWLLYYELKIIELYPAIWNIAGAKPGRLLFSDDDMRAPHASHIFKMLNSHYKKDVRQLVIRVENLLRTAPEYIESFSVSASPAQLLEVMRKDQLPVRVTDGDLADMIGRVAGWILLSSVLVSLLAGYPSTAMWVGAAAATFVFVNVLRKNRKP